MQNNMIVIYWPSCSLNIDNERLISVDHYFTHFNRSWVFINLFRLQFKFSAGMSGGDVA